MKKSRVIFSWISVIVVIGFVSLVLSMLITPQIIAESPVEIPSSTQPVPKQSPPAITETIVPKSSPPSSAIPKEPPATSASKESVEKEINIDKPLIQDPLKDNLEPIPNTDSTSHPATKEVDNRIKTDNKPPKEHSGTIIRTFPTIQHLSPTNTIPPINEAQQTPVHRPILSFEHSTFSPQKSERSDERQGFDAKQMLKPKKNQKPIQSVEKVECFDTESFGGNENNVLQLKRQSIEIEHLEMGWAKVGYEVLKLEQERKRLITSLGNNPN